MTNAIAPHPTYGFTRPRDSEKWEPAFAKPWHDRLIDFLLVNPGMTSKEIGEQIGRHPATIQMVMASDLFKERYAQRRASFESNLKEQLTGKIAKVANLTLDLTLAKLAEKRTAIPLPELMDLQDKTLSMLGFGPKAGAGTVVNVNAGTHQTVVAPVSKEVLEASRNALLVHQQSRLIEHQPLERSVAGHSAPSGVAADSSAKE